jgi:thiopeptide-type bacteriocin biosynthesis protein
MNNIKRTYIPGDEWLYIKLYTGYKTADRFLAEELPEIINKLKADKAIDKWFFIRYSDPHYHLRLRFFLKDPNDSLALSVINQSIKPYVSERLIWKVQADTYQRELERYGSETIDFAETIFNYDSEAIINIIKLLEGSVSDHYRWLIALKMIDNLLDDFEFNIDRKIQLLSNLSENFKTEFGFTRKEYKLQLDKKFRDNRKAIEEIINNTTNKPNWIIPFVKIIDQKSQNIKPVTDTLMDMEQSQALKVPLNDLLGSYIHMMSNRLFRTKQRLIEMVLYDMLERHYSSLKAKIKYKPINAKEQVVSI